MNVQLQQNGFLQFSNNIYQVQMKNCIFIAFFTLFFLNITVTYAEQQKENPTLVFFVDHEDEPQKDYVEITLQIEAKDTSLTNTINTAAETVEDISNMAKQFCLDNAKKKNQCKQIIDAGKFEIEPRYQLIRKQPVFMGFTVTHQMTIAVKSVQNIGYLVDKILTQEGITLKKFQWKALEQPKTHEDAIAQGMEEAEGLCSQLGLKLGRIISIQQMNGSQANEQKQQEQQEEDDEEQEQDDENASLFRFEVECVPSQEKEL